MTNAIPLSEVSAEEEVRLRTGLKELDRVLGGGIARSSAILVAGAPGIGKSTLLLQAGLSVNTRGPVLYVSAEESARHIRLRADRVATANGQLQVLEDRSLQAVLGLAHRVEPSLIIVDSLQMLVDEDLSNPVGSPSQLKACCDALCDWARAGDRAVLMIAHVTKEGLIAGPKQVEHMVDTVIHFEDTQDEYRFIRATKNRYGDTGEIGLLRMTETGLQDLGESAGIFTTLRPEGSALPPGVAFFLAYEGSRVIPVELQALTVPARAGVPRIFSDRIDVSRVARVAAVLERASGADTASADLYVNVAGGFRVRDVATDLPLALAMYSAHSGKALPVGLTAVGEVSLTGELRPGVRLDRRLKAARDLGFSRVLGPGDHAAPEGTELLRARDLSEALRVVFGSRNS